MSMATRRTKINFISDEFSPNFRYDDEPEMATVHHILPGYFVCDVCAVCCVCVCVHVYLFTVYEWKGMGR